MPHQVVLAQRSDLHLMRKLWHLSTGLLGLSIYYRTGWTTKTWAIITLSIALSGLLFDFIRLNNKDVNKLAIKVLKPFMRHGEDETYTGLPFYALGVSLSLFFFPERLALLSIFFLVLSDPISSFFGVLYGRDKIIPGKSIQGTLAGFITCYLTTLVYGLFYMEASLSLLAFALIAGIIGAVSELFSVIVDDNLSIPVLSGLGLWFINLFFHLF
ncbi:MAG: hypothetical protein HOE90_12675 [Bacteriovoracaceae bacterium]|jgi:diacylglycerol kinase (CTP)|nr:hypothetical protein [Bacteriovoracaceae bacterium]